MNDIRLRDRLAVARVAGARGSALGAAPHRESLQQLAVEPDIELLGPTHAHQVFLILPAQTHLDLIFATDGKVMPCRDPAPGPKRQVFTLPIVLHDVLRNLERLERRTRRRQTRGEPRHLPGD